MDVVPAVSRAGFPHRDRLHRGVLPCVGHGIEISRDLPGIYVAELRLGGGDAIILGSGAVVTVET